MDSLAGWSDTVSMESGPLSSLVCYLSHATRMYRRMCKPTAGKLFGSDKSNAERTTQVPWDLFECWLHSRHYRNIWCMRSRSLRTFLEDRTSNFPSLPRITIDICSASRNLRGAAGYLCSNVSICGLNLYRLEIIIKGNLTVISYVDHSMWVNRVGRRSRFVCWSACYRSDRPTNNENDNNIMILPVTVLTRIVVTWTCLLQTRLRLQTNVKFHFPITLGRRFSL